MIRLVFIFIALFVSCAASAQRALTTPDFSGFMGRDGVGEAAIKKLVPLPDGGALVVGTFDVWYEGLRFRDLLKLRADGNPDTSWHIEWSSGSIFNATVTPIGVFLIGGFDKVNGVDAAGGVPYLSLANGQLLNASPSVAAVGLQAYALSTHDTLTNHVYVRTIDGMRRISTLTGALDPAWFFRPKATDESQLGEKMLADSAGGLWITSWTNTGYFGRDMTHRFILAGAATSEAALPSTAQKTLPDLSLTDVVGNYVYLNTSGRYRKTDGEQSPFWDAAGVSYVSEKFAYFGTGQGFRPRGILRAATSGDGTPDNWLLPDSAAYTELAADSALFPWPTPGDSGNLARIMKKPANDNTVFPPTFIVKEDLVGNEDPTVIEYYVPALKHYFLTGRKNEQAALDALPQSFTRTGMRFAAKSSRYRDIPEIPVCRMYASPDKGGSNSHFYGLGSDCATLNKLSGLKYEGYDFSVLKPVSSTCSAAAPNPVWRLFNNKAATNDGNHRYVVSAATKRQMVAQGWLDEGVVFCSTSVTDATN